MENEKKVKTLEDEFKLIKGQLKETLSSVRDYLLTSEIPASEYATIMAALGVGGGGQQMSMRGEIAAPKKEDNPEASKSEEEEPAEEEVVEEEEPSEEELGEEGEPFSSESESSSEEELVGQDEPFANESELAPEEGLPEEGEPLADESELAPEGELPEEREPLSNEPGFPEQRMEHGKAAEEVSQSAPPVNLMANLIRWVSTAKREIGSEQLPVFLEVYGITGHLSPELKEVILYLADITSEQSAETNAAEIWSRLISELHGILTGGDAPLHPVRPFWNEGGDEIEPVEAEVEKEADKPVNKPLKLKLVLSDGEGGDKEFCINLNQEESKESL